MAQSTRVNAALTVLTVASIPGLWRDLETGDQLGEAVALGTGVAVGAAAAILGRTPWPFLGAIAVCLFMLHLQSVRAGNATAAPAAPGAVSTRTAPGTRRGNT